MQSFTKVCRCHTYLWPSSNDPASFADKCDELESELLEAKSHIATMAPEIESLRMEKKLEPLLDSDESLTKMREEKKSLRKELYKEKEAAAKSKAELRAKLEGAKQDMEKLRQEARSHKTKRHALTAQLNNVRVMHRGSEAEVARLQEEVRCLKERNRGNREVTS